MVPFFSLLFFCLRDAAASMRTYVYIHAGVLFVVQLCQVPLGAAELHRHPRHGHPRPPEAAEANDVFLPVL